MTSSPPIYRRILLKLSGEALLGGSEFGISGDVLARLADEIAGLVANGVGVTLVVGGGNIFRGVGLSGRGMDRVTGDQMGMLSTVINALALQDALEKTGLTARVMSALRINEVCEDYIRRRAIRHLDKGRVVVLAAGTGNPFFTTDSAASLRAVEVGAEILLKATKVDGIYSADPAREDSAQRYTHLTHDEVIDSRLQVMDTTAMVLCRDNDMPIRVFNVQRAGEIGRIVHGIGDAGTLVDSGPKDKGQ
ncbi:UMP kinase [Salinisphaera sp. USBA-960]|uniref:UMP kinase n=1 Tax=Salinisphaera orenii TaxID=856731 RepID=UPI000DBE2F86|nr:UMP kinase [Salifodinibacter halophilus]NNC26215.1 UMP kinase [Salifodinibacter halophilus]